MTPDTHNAMRLKKMLSLDDFENAARRHLPLPIFGYVQGAAEDNVSVEMTRNSFREYAFIPRVLADVSQRLPDTMLFGRQYSAPVGIAPMGLSALIAYRGDIVMAQAACAANVPTIMSGSSLIRLEDVAKVNPDAWFQAYLPGEDDRIAALIERVHRGGLKTLVITVVTSVAANRENNIRTGFASSVRC